MKSDKPSDWLDLEQDLVTTPDDIRALREHRPRAGADWLEQIEALSPEKLAPGIAPRRTTSAGYLPFEL